MMPESPSHAELRLCKRLQLSDASAASLIAAMRAGASSRQAVVLTPLAPQDYVPPFACVDTTAWGWLPPAVFVPVEGEKPTAHADYREKGYYYSLDLSSCWESAALAVVPQPGSSLDMCAAPGGKTMLMAARHLPQHHVANEVSPSRRGILRQNLEHCGVPNTEVTGLRPDQWGAAGQVFDLLLVDAPCSGQSLLAKGIRNPGCLGASMVNGNAKRQKGILLAAVRCVAPGGHLLYTTCTYDPDENEKVIAYILKRMPSWRAVEVPELAPFRSALVDFPAYRLLPEHGFGAGGFCCLLKNT
ncbi:MAG: RsmB/NOP family class I SAM-dependent RNA methyltransferase [Akkermansia sp.]|nr:RsmB/NOP family class I SAM-dependent RNA methyltransferase [Akkermansia sp.]